MHPVSKCCVSLRVVALCVTWCYVSLNAGLTWTPQTTGSVWTRWLVAQPGGLMHPVSKCYVSLRVVERRTHVDTADYWLGLDAVASGAAGRANASSI